MPKRAVALRPVLASVSCHMGSLKIMNYSLVPCAFRIVTVYFSLCLKIHKISRLSFDTKNKMILISILYHSINEDCQIRINIKHFTQK